MYWIEKIKKFNYTSLDHTFLITNKDGIIPVEVKASDNTKSRSLNVYMEKYNPSYAIRGLRILVLNIILNLFLCMLFLYKITWLYVIFKNIIYVFVQVIFL